MSIARNNDSRSLCFSYENVVCTTVVFWVFCRLTFDWSALVLDSSAWSVYVNCISFVFHLMALWLVIMCFVLRPFRSSPVQIVCIVLLALVLLISSIRIQNSNLLFAFSIVLAASQVNMRKLARWYLVATVVFLLVLFYLLLRGKIENVAAQPNDRVVYSYGMPHPNMLGMELVAVGMSSLYAFWDKRLWRWCALYCGMASIFCLWLLSSRTSFLLLGVLSLVAILAHCRHPACMWMKDFAKDKLALVALLVFVVLLSASVLGMLFYSKDVPFLVYLNRLVSGRLELAHQAFVSNDGFTFLGRFIKFNGTTAITSNPALTYTQVDNGYARAGITIGTSSFVALSCIFIISIAVLAQRKDYFGIILLCLSSIYLAMESGAIYLSRDFAVLLLGSAFSDSVIPCLKKIASSSRTRG